MSEKKANEPEGFLGFDEAELQRLPINFTGVGKQAPMFFITAPADSYRTDAYICQPYYKPLSRVLSISRRPHDDPENL